MSFEDLDLDFNLEEALGELKASTALGKIKDPGPEKYDTRRENEKRELMQQMAFYAEEGPTWDPEGKYLCGSCYFRALMDWGDTPYCYIVEGKVSMEDGSCQFYRYGNPDSEWNPLPMGKKYTKEEANYAERPKVKGFGCYPRCEYASPAEGKDKDGREFWCGQFGVHVRAKACCAFEDGKDLVQISAGGPGSGCNPDVGKCGRPEGPQKTDYMATKLSGPKGSNPGGLYKGSDGIERYVKIYNDPKSARGEELANHIYYDLDLAVPKTELFEHEGKLAIATVIVPPSTAGGKTLQEYGLNKTVANSIMNGFAADVLTVNWDAVGLQHDNIIVSKGGTTYRIDQGGTFLKRAQGGDKPESLLNQITEVEKFFDKNKNAAYAKVAETAGIKSVADMKDRFEAQVKAITDLRDAVGGWKNYVATQSQGNMPKDEQQKIATMLEARTNLMQSLVYGMDKTPDKENVTQSKPPVEEQTETKESKWRQYNPNAVGGYFRQGTAIATIYQTLTSKEGQWFSVNEIKKGLEGKSTANIDNRFNELKYTGKRSGKWSVEVSGDNARIFLTKGGEKSAVQDVKEDQQSIAVKYATQAVQAKGPWEKDLALANMFKEMGISQNSSVSLTHGVKSWTGSSDSGGAQAWRSVAMQYYNREPKDEFVEYNKVIGTNNNLSTANKMKDAAMALKAFSAEYARQNKVNVVYRNVGGKQGQEVIQAMRGAIAAGKSKIQISLNSLSSWSDRKDLSIGGPIKLRMKIDPDNVWAIHEASPEMFTAYKGEHEYVIGVHSPKETFSLDDISVDASKSHGLGLTSEEEKSFKKIFAQKEPEKKDNDVYTGFVVGPLDDNWQHKDEEKEDKE